MAFSECNAMHCTRKRHHAVIVALTKIEIIEAGISDQSGHTAKFDSANQTSRSATSGAKARRGLGEGEAVFCETGSCDTISSNICLTVGLRFPQNNVQT